MINLNKLHLFEWQELYHIEFETSIGFSAFKALILSQENSLDSQEEQFREMLENDKVFNEINSDDHGHYYSHVYEWDEMTIKEIKRLQRYSNVLSIFSFYEGRLKTICTTIENSFDFKIKVEDLNSNEDLMRYWNYLEKVFEIDTDSIAVYFTPIKQQKIVRNIIAHQEGVVRENQRKKIAIVKGLEVKLSGYDSIIEISNIEYIADLLDKMDKFFKKLILEIDTRYKHLEGMKNNLLNDAIKEIENNN